MQILDSVVISQSQRSLAKGETGEEKEEVPIASGGGKGGGGKSGGGKGKKKKKTDDFPVEENTGGKGAGKKKICVRKFCFSDGRTTCFALEKCSLLDKLPRNLPNGAKILLKNGARVRRGLIMLEPRHVELVAW